MNKPLALPKATSTTDYVKRNVGDCLLAAAMLPCCQEDQTGMCTAVASQTLTATSEKQY
jgi:hypothetical protein